jgi:hypothetical protein
LDETKEQKYPIAVLDETRNRKIRQPYWARGGREKSDSHIGRQEEEKNPTAILDGTRKRKIRKPLTYC